MQQVVTIWLMEICLVKWIIKLGSCYYRKEGYKSAWWKNKEEATVFKSIVEVMALCNRYNAKYEEVE